ESLLVLTMPADGQPMAPQHCAGFACQDTVVGLVGAVGAMPYVCCLAVAITDAVEAVKDAPMMRGVDGRIVGQTTGCQHVAFGRVKVMKHFVSSVATFLGSLIERVVVVTQHAPRSEMKLGKVTGMVVPGESITLGRRFGRQSNLEGQCFTGFQVRQD